MNRRFEIGTFVRTLKDVSTTEGTIPAGSLGVVISDHYIQQKADGSIAKRQQVKLGSKVVGIGPSKLEEIEAKLVLV